MGQNQNKGTNLNNNKLQGSFVMRAEGQNIKPNDYAYFDSEEKYCVDMLCGLGRNPANIHVITFLQVFNYNLESEMEKSGYFTIRIN